MLAAFYHVPCVCVHGAVIASGLWVSCVSPLQINRNGYKQVRNIAVDPMRCRLLNFSKRMRLIKALPLKQLIQIEKSTCNTCLLSLVFSSNGQSSCRCSTTPCCGVFCVAIGCR